MVSVVGNHFKYLFAQGISETNVPNLFKFVISIEDRSQESELVDPETHGHTLWLSYSWKLKGNYKSQR